MATFAVVHGRICFKSVGALSKFWIVTFLFILRRYMTCKWHWLMGYVTIYLTQACWDVPWLVGAMTWQRSWEHLASASIKTSLNRKCIFKGSIFHCYVSLPECTPLKINIEASQKLKITQLMKRKNIFKTSNFGLHVYSIIFQGEKKKHSPPPKKKKHLRIPTFLFLLAPGFFLRDLIGRLCSWPIKHPCHWYVLGVPPAH